MLTGKRPFDDGGHPRTPGDGDGLRPAPPVSGLVEDVDPGLVTLVRCCLERDPARRFGSAADLAKALDSVRARFVALR